MLYQALGDSPTRKEVRDLVERDNRLAAAGVILAKQLNSRRSQAMASVTPQFLIVVQQKKVYLEQVVLMVLVQCKHHQEVTQ